MNKKKTAIIIGVVLVVLILIIVGIVLTSSLYQKTESIGEAMKDSVLHEDKKINLFGLSVNPGLIAAYIVTAALLLVAAIIRIFAIPRFKILPNKFQIVIEKAVEMFQDMAKENSPHRNGFLGAYIFVAACYIFFGTLFELCGIQVISTSGSAVTLPAPLSDINGAIAMGLLSYLIILSGGIAGNKMRGFANALKDFSLPISMSFRLFGALLSGVLVSELVYYSISLSFVLPVIVAVLFTLLHALIQAYVLTTLTSLFYGESAEPSVRKEKKIKNQTHLSKAA